MSVKIYHNPRCSKSRQALELLKEKGIDPQIMLYLENGISYDEAKDLFQRLNLNAALPMVRIKEPEFKDAGLSKTSSDEELLHGIATYPKLLERPIVITDKGAEICRPPEKIMNII